MQSRLTFSGTEFNNIVYPLQKWIRSKSLWRHTSYCISQWRLTSDIYILWRHTRFVLHNDVLPVTSFFDVTLVLWCHKTYSFVWPSLCLCIMIYLILLYNICHSLPYIYFLMLSSEFFVNCVQDKSSHDWY